MQSLGHSFTVIPSIDSTNNYAMQMVHARLAKHGDTWFALEQTKGKGQRGRSWLSSKGENIILSLVLQPGFLVPMQSFLLNAAIALGTYDFFQKYAGAQTRIKWPNDIYWCDRKAGGILIENIIRSEHWLFAVTGIGLNINQVSFPEDLQKAISLREITGKNFEVIEGARELCFFLEQRYNALKAGNQKQILEDYGQAMYKLNEKIKFKKNGVLIEALVKGVTADGLLMVETDNGEQEWLWGTAEWIV